MDKKEKIKLLQWFVDFAYADLERIEVSEFMKLSTTVQLLVAGGIWGEHRLSLTLDEAAGALNSAPHDEKRLKAIRDVQAAFREHVEQALQEIDRYDAESSKFLEWEVPTPIPDPGSLKIRPLSQPIPIKISVKPTLSLIFEGKEDQGKTYIRLVSEWRRESTLRAASQTEREGDMLLLIFLGAINGISVDAFRRCQECFRWYVHASRRERVYCSNLCAARSANRARRARDKETKPKKYEKEIMEGAKRARKSYVQKIQSRVGNVKVGKRPRKYKA